MAIKKKTKKAINAIKKSGIRKYTSKQTGQRIFDSLHRTANNLKIKHAEMLVLEMKPLENNALPDKDYKMELVRKTEMLNYLFTKRDKWFKNAAKRRLNEGDLCFIAKTDGNAVSCLWATFNSLYISPVEYTLKIDDETVALFDSYTLQDFRGMGIYSKLWQYCLNYFANSQYNKVWVCVNPINIQSIIVHKKLGNKIVKNIILNKRLGIKSHKITSGLEHKQLFE